MENKYYTSDQIFMPLLKYYDINLEGK